MRLQQHGKVCSRGFEPGWPGKQQGWIELIVPSGLSPIGLYPFRAPPTPTKK